MKKILCASRHCYFRHYECAEDVWRKYIREASEDTVCFFHTRDITRVLIKEEETSRYKSSANIDEKEVLLGHALGVWLKQMFPQHDIYFLSEQRLWSPVYDGLKFAGIGMKIFGFIGNGRAYVLDEHVTYCGPTFCAFGYDQMARYLHEDVIEEYRRTIERLCKEFGWSLWVAHNSYPHNTYPD